MSVQHSSWAMTVPVNSPVQRLALIFIADRCDMDGVVSIESVERDFDQFAATTGDEYERALFALEDDGLITWAKREVRLCFTPEVATPLGEVSPSIRRTMLLNACCRACGSIDRLQVDHIVPRSKQGTNDPSNLQVLCQPCNASKGNKLPDDWKGRL